MLQSIIFICLEECCGDCVAVLFQKRNTSKEQRLLVVLALVFVHALVLLLHRGLPVLVLHIIFTICCHYYY